MLISRSGSIRLLRHWILLRNNFLSKFWAIKVSVEADKPDDEDLDLASRCVDLLEKSDPKKHFEMLSLFRDEFNKAGLEQKSKLLPSIFSQVCEIGIKMNENGDKELW